MVAQILWTLHCLVRMELQPCHIFVAPYVPGGTCFTGCERYIYYDYCINIEVLWCRAMQTFDGFKTWPKSSKYWHLTKLSIIFVWAGKIVNIDTNIFPLHCCWQYLSSCLCHLLMISVWNEYSISIYQCLVLCLRCTPWWLRGKLQKKLHSHCSAGSITTVTAQKLTGLFYHSIHPSKCSRFWYKYKSGRSFYF